MGTFVFMGFWMIMRSQKLQTTKRLTQKNPIKVKDNGYIDKEKGKEVVKPLTQLPRPPSSTHRVKNKVEVVSFLSLYPCLSSCQ